MHPTSAADDTAEIHTIANLSPVSPAPLTTTAVSALPVLQSQADSLDDAGAAQAHDIASMAHISTLDAFGIMTEDRDSATNGDEDTSLDDDLYGESEQEGPAKIETTTSIDRVVTEIDDEYAKTFDSPLSGEEEEEQQRQDGERDENGESGNGGNGNDTAETTTVSEAAQAIHVSSSLANLSVPDTLMKTAQPFGASSTAATATATAGATAQASSFATALSSADIPMTDLNESSKPDSEASATAVEPSSSSPAANNAGQQMVLDSIPTEKPEESSSPLPVATSSDVPTPQVSHNDKSSLPQVPMPLPTAPITSASNTQTLPPASADLPSRPPVDMNRIHLDTARSSGSQASIKVGQSVSSLVNQTAPGTVSSSLPATVPGQMAPPPPGMTETMAALGPPPGPTNSSLPQASLGATTTSSTSAAMSYPGAPPSSSGSETNRNSNYHRLWDLYVADEMRYIAEQKWDRFPEGSRVFIGNLSSDKVSKRDVFNLFHRYGRLAQISLKSAFGFVQYHTLEEAQAAVENLQGIEVKGRKIHLEFSRVQKKKEPKEERTRSPDSSGPRGRDRESGHHRGGRLDGGPPGRRGRDEPRHGHGRHGSDYRSHHRDDSYGRDRQHRDSYRSRDRSFSPRGRGRDWPDRDSYRRRSRSPYGASRPKDDGRAYGHESAAAAAAAASSSPDVQLLLLQEVDPNFVNWVRGAFTERGLRTDVMIVNPAYHIKKDVISRLVVDGVCGIAELDFAAQERGEVYLHLYDLSRGLSNVSFNEYQGLKPATAADLVIRTKTKPAQPSYHPAPAPYGVPPQGGSYYSQAPPPHAVAPPPLAGGPPSYASQHGPVPGTYPLPQGVSSGTSSTPNGGVDLQQILSQLQKPGSAPIPPPGASAPQKPPAAAAPGGIDIQAILGSLKGGGPSAPPQPPPSAGYPTSGTYSTGPNTTGYNHGQAPGFGLSSAPPPARSPPMPTGVQGTDAQVKNIMAQLARFRR